MMKSGKILRRLAAREMKKNRLQFASMIAITMLAVTLFCGFISNTKTLERAVNKYFTSTNLCDLCVQMGKITDTEKEYFSSLDAVAEYRAYADGTLDGKSSKLYVGDTSVSRPEVVQGFSGVTIDQRTAELNNISVGADVTLGVTLPLGSRYYDVEMEAKVTGLMNFPETTVSASSVAVYISESKFE